MKTISALLIVLFLTACGGSSDSTPPTDPAENSTWGEMEWGKGKWEK